MVANLLNVDQGLGQRVAQGLGVKLPTPTKAARAKVEMKPSPALSIQRNAKATLNGRKIGVLVADGGDAATLHNLRTAVEKEGASLFLVSPRVHNVTLSDGATVKADGQLLGSPSPLFDAVAIVLDAKQAQALTKEGAAVKWVMEAFGHLKAIGAEASAKPLLDKAGVEKDDGVCGLGADFLKAAKTRQWAREPKVRMLA
jgi:catalase